MSNIVLIDSDIVAVAASAAAEERFWSVRGRRFKTKKELRAAFPGTEDDEIERIIEPQPFSHARNNARGLWQSILDSCAPVGAVRGYLSGADNFRHKLATLKPYKGNRDRSEEPVWRKEVEAFLLNEYEVTRTQGFEADDALAMDFVKDTHHSIISSQDKDFLTIENVRMWNWRKNEMIHVEPLEAKRNFYTQMLTGDVCDNIGGVSGMGPAKSGRLLAPMKDVKAMEYVVYYAFKKEYGVKAWEAFVETGRLLYLWRKPDDQWNPIITK